MSVVSIYNVLIFSRKTCLFTYFSFSISHTIKNQREILGYNVNIPSYVIFYGISTDVDTFPESALNPQLLLDSIRL